MRFSTAAFTLLAAPLAAEAACKLSFHQTANWDESGRRYRVRAEASGVPNTHEMIARMCQAYRTVTNGYPGFIQNPVCSQLNPEGHLADIDTSVAHGPAGLASHNGLYDEVVKLLWTAYVEYRPCEFDQHSTW